MNSQIRGTVLLFITALIWGTAFVAQSVGAETMGPFTFNFARAILAGIFLIPTSAVMSAIDRKNGLSTTVDGTAAGTSVQAAENGPEAEKSAKSGGKTLIIGGIACGVALFVASNLQQLGIQYTTIGKAGFLTAMYILLVPIASIFLGKKPGAKVWIGVVIAVVGMYMLCMTQGLTIAPGDFYTILCAFAFTVQIMLIDHFSPKVDGVKMSCIQFWVVALLSAIMMMIFEKPDPAVMLAAWKSIAYAGIMSSGVAYTLQIIAQKDLNPTVASLLMSLESVISALSGWLILHQSMSFREICGCVLMFAAIILAELPDRKNKSA